MSSLVFIVLLCNHICAVSVADGWANAQGSYVSFIRYVLAFDYIVVEIDY